MKQAALLIALMFAAGAPAYAQEAPRNRFAATEVASERFEAGALAVERHGKRGTPLILIPGLASGSWVWQDAIRTFRDDHVLYVVTLPGFDGRAPIPGNMLGEVQRSLHQLISSRKLVKPVLVGHSLGGTLSLALAQQHPDMIGGVVSIDGLPVFPGTEDMQPEQRPQLAEGIMRRMAGLTPAAFASQQQQYMRSIGVVDMARADELAKLTARSDPAATVQYMAAVMGQDLRPGLPQVKAPVLVLAPFLQLDANDPNAGMASKVGYYTELMSGTPRVNVVGIPGARHFAMIDQPQRVTDAIRAFLKSL
ncbi:alpha/beta fold hydrolase [Massilia sp. GCM10020059]|uniref:Alpha/beta hydrolase n=1 Tax=Massilia agrisoli TaxID=2892444 RepID=A0ABS8IXE9_9BURK|nr:alpha/beta hydrolase [Massilia agrisoli]MCC6072492.1 alpha/beta hydrolase [Massilia agrisoli]